MMSLKQEHDFITGIKFPLGAIIYVNTFNALVPKGTGHIVSQVRNNDRFFPKVPSFTHSSITKFHLKIFKAKLKT